jgi:hypothetical protein
MKISSRIFVNNVLRILTLCIVLAGSGLFIASCGEVSSSTSAGPGGATPTEAYKKLYAAVKSKNIDAIKSNLSKKTIDFATMVSGKNNTPLEKVFENGFTATTFADSLPEIRDERVNENMGNVEVWNSKDKRWEDLPFILEDGGWRLAVGDLFAGTFKSAGKGRAQKEAEAANVMSGDSVVPLNPNINGNFNGGSGPLPKKDLPVDSNKP